LWVRLKPSKVIRKKPVTVGLPLPVIRLAAPLEVAKIKGLFAGLA
jgi:hypothetical protein